ncbi:hypothetical protein HMPREF9081_1111 [Centipeda periodontii DSM 2778]|uniref:Uncharacterized protein n=1 Tax=Centipeda periodontii DSM 2778 TaxID=888060 RepID=F5RLH5_9FIRM|nr:hypothetical protein HMPREF9081_1111 [Centipeda periodontii DSM 2778]
MTLQYSTQDKRLYHIRTLLTNILLSCHDMCAIILHYLLYCILQNFFKGESE